MAKKHRLSIYMSFHCRSGEDLKQLGISAQPKEENSLLVWTGVIKGPEPFYAGGNFKIEVVFTNEQVIAAGFKLIMN